MAILESLVADLNERFALRYGERGGPDVRRAVAKMHDPRLSYHHPDALFVTLYTTRPYMASPGTARHAGGMHRAVLRVDLDGQNLVVTPHSPVLKCLKPRTSCLAVPEFDPVPWLLGVTVEAEEVLLQRLKPATQRLPA